MSGSERSDTPHSELVDGSDIDLDSDFDSDDEIPLAELIEDGTPLAQFVNQDVVNDQGDTDNSSAWTSELSSFDIAEFVESVGPVTGMNNDKTESDFFHLLFDKEIYKLIADQTNAYARLKGPDPKWYDTNADEMKAFIGFNVVMAIIVAPNQDMYFTKDTMFRPGAIHERISRDRMDKLCQYFHVADVTGNPARGQPGHDRLAHIRPLIEAVLPRLKAEYKPHRESSIDEAMVAFTGRLGFKQYVPMKPTKRGIKVWMRADPHNGYVNEFQVYTGKEGNNVERGLGERVVRDLSKDILGRNHHIYCDNYFTSVPLFLDLLKDKTYACGTVRTNRVGLPAAVASAKINQQGDVVMRQKGELVCSAWRDKRTVVLLSTNADPTDTTTVQRKQKDGSIRDVNCPSVVKKYTQHMNGVDRADQLRSAYSLGRKSNKWWKYLFWFIVDVCMCNAFVLMRESANHQQVTRNGNRKEARQLDFRKKIAHQLIGTYRCKRKRESISNVSSTGLLHWPTELAKKRTCKQCSKSGKRREIKSGCEQCEINLCITCFKAYHRDNFPELFQ